MLRYYSVLQRCFIWEIEYLAMEIISFSIMLKVSSALLLSASDHRIKNIFWLPYFVVVLYSRQILYLFLEYQQWIWIQRVKQYPAQQNDIAVPNCPVKITMGLQSYLVHPTLQGPSSYVHCVYAWPCTPGLTVNAQRWCRLDADTWKLLQSTPL